MNTFRHGSILMILLTVLISCSDDDSAITVPEIESNTITTVRITLVSTIETNLVDMGSTFIFEYKDLDGDGPIEPVISNVMGFNPNEPNNITLRPAIYEGSIALFDESSDELIDRTPRIASDPDNHQFFYSFTGDELPPIVTYDDMDTNGNPVGLRFILDNTVGGQKRYNFNISLLQNLDKNAEGVLNGDSTDAGGDVILDISMPGIGRNL